MKADQCLLSFSNKPICSSWVSFSFLRDSIFPALQTLFHIATYMYLMEVNLFQIAFLDACEFPTELQSSYTNTKRSSVSAPIVFLARASTDFIWDSSENWQIFTCFWFLWDVWLKYILEATLRNVLSHVWAGDSISWWSYLIKVSIVFPWEWS